MKTYLIDGNNLMHKIPDLKQKINLYYHVACSALLNQINNYSIKYQSYSFIVFFDKLNDQILSPAKNIKILSHQSNTADDEIKNYIKKLQSTKNVILVSSDTELFNFGKGYACEVLTSEDFIKLFSQINVYQAVGQIHSKKQNKKNEKPNTSSKREIEEFKKLFGAN